MNLAIRTKLFGACALACFGLAGAVLFIVWRLEASMSLAGSVMEVRAPMAQHGVELLNGLNSSVSSLRGYMQHQDEKFKTERRRLWNGVIEPLQQSMMTLARHSSANEDSRELASIEKMCEEVRAAQEKVEAVCHTLENTPAQKIFLEKAAPQAGEMIGALGAMISEELHLDENAVRKPLLKQLVEAREHVTDCVINLRAYLSGGDEKFSAATSASFSNIDKLVGGLEHNQSLFSPSQHIAFNRLVRARSDFHPLLKNIFQIRGDDRWNVAAHLLETEVTPQLAELHASISAIVNKHQTGIRSNSRDVRESMASLKTLLWIFLACGICCSAIFAGSMFRSVIRPLGTVAAGARMLASGNVYEEISISGGKEFDEIAANFKALSSGLREKAEVAGKIAEGDFSVNVRLVSSTDHLGRNLAFIIDAVRGLQQPVEPLLLESRAAETKDGRVYAKVSRAIEDSLAAMRFSIDEAAKVLECVASRDLTIRSSGEGNGESALIKEVLNEAVGILDAEFSSMAARSARVAEYSRTIDEGCHALTQTAARQIETTKQASDFLSMIDARREKHDTLVNDAGHLIADLQMRTEKQTAEFACFSDGLNNLKAGAEAAAVLFKTLNEIAIRAKMLSINAAIEAAHAGEAGKSFAVVAGELGNLATSSAVTARNSEAAMTTASHFFQNGCGGGKSLVENFSENARLLQQAHGLFTEATANACDHAREMESLRAAVQQSHELAGQNLARAEGLTDFSGKMSETTDALQNDFSHFRFTLVEDGETISEISNHDDETSRLSPSQQRRLIEARHAQYDNHASLPERTGTFSVQQEEGLADDGAHCVDESLENDAGIFHPNGATDNFARSGDAKIERVNTRLQKSIRMN